MITGPIYLKKDRWDFFNEAMTYGSVGDVSHKAELINEVCV